MKTQQVILTIVLLSLGALDLYLTTYQFTVFSAVVHVPIFSLFCWTIVVTDVIRQKENQNEYKF